MSGARKVSDLTDIARAGLAIGASVDYVISAGRVMSDEAKRNGALAIAMGIMHGCCGPNGDFTSDYRPSLATQPKDTP